MGPHTPRHKIPLRFDDARLNAQMHRHSLEQLKIHHETELASLHGVARLFGIVEHTRIGGSGIKTAEPNGIRRQEPPCFLEALTGAHVVRNQNFFIYAFEKLCHGSAKR